MAKKVPGKLNSQKLREEVSIERADPVLYRIGRDAVFQLDKVGHRNYYTKLSNNLIKEAKEKEIKKKENKNTEGILVNKSEIQQEQQERRAVYELVDKISDMDVIAFFLTLQQTVYNQSYKSGNEDVNSGLTRNIAEECSKDTGMTLYRADIKVLLIDFCRNAYGTENPTEMQRRKVEILFDIFHQYPKHVFINGAKILCYLCTKESVEIRNKDGAII